MTDLTDDDRARLRELAALDARAREVLGQVAYLGHLTIDSGDRRSEVLLGRASRPGPQLSLVDWREAPIAEVFFTHGEGEAYEIEVDGRPVAGTLLRRELLIFDEGQLAQVEYEGRRLVKLRGEWRALAPAPELAMPDGASTEALSPSDVTLDPDQQRLVDLPRQRHLLIQGEAGFGKTTVALRRLATLRAKSKGHFHAAVIVPTEGLRRLTRLLLDRLGAADVDVESFDRWAGIQARRAFRDTPRRETSGARSGVVQLKRHPALLPVLQEIAAHPGRDEDGASLGPRTRMRARRTDLHHLFGDRALMEKVVANGAGALPLSAAADAVEHTRKQFGETAEEQFAGVTDATRLQTLDGRTLDEATPEEDAGTVDAEDYAVLFEIDRLRSLRMGERPAKLPKYDCLVVDEAQELAPIELQLLGRCLAPGGSLIVAGDAAQQVDGSAAFAGWEATLRHLGAGSFETGQLSQNHRCPPEVTELARPLRLAGGVSPLKPSGPIAVERFDHELEATLRLAEVLRTLKARHPGRTAAVICRDADAARATARLLRHAIDATLALDGDFDFKPGVAVTAVGEVKGLEFDHVIVPDCAPAAYPDLPDARRALYVAVTRPTRSLLVATIGRWAPLVAVT